MENLPLHLRLRKARKELGFTQAALAKEIGKSTSAVCQLEKGERRALAGSVVQELCQFLKVEFAPAEEDVAAMLQEERNVLAICKNERCPVANFAFDDGELIIQPKAYRVPSSTEPGCCIYCGHQLETGCSLRCLTPIVQGAAFCTGCHKPLVKISPQTLRRGDLKEYAEERAKRRNTFLSSTNDITELPASIQKNSGRSP